MSDYETSQRKRDAYVGAFIVIGVCALVWLIFKFGDLPLFVSGWRSYTVRVQFPTAPGVQENTPVRFCGYHIGRVTDIEHPRLLKDRKTGQFYHQTMVVLGIDKRYNNIPADVEVKLMTRGFGSSYVELRAGAPEKSELMGGKFLTDGSLLQGSTGTTSEFFPEETQDKLDELAGELRLLVNNANDLIGDETTKENFKSALANLAAAVKQFQEFSAAGTTTLKNADARLEKIVTAVIDLSEELSGTVSELRLILEKVNDGQGTTAKLLNDGRLYENLLESSHQMQILLKDFSAFLDEAREKGVPIKLK